MFINAHKHTLKTHNEVTRVPALFPRSQSLIISFLFPVAEAKPAAPPRPPSFLPGSDREIEGVINSELRGCCPLTCGSLLHRLPPPSSSSLHLPPLTLSLHTIFHLILSSCRVFLCADRALKWCLGWFKGKNCTFNYVKYNLLIMHRDFHCGHGVNSFLCLSIYIRPPLT